MKSLNPILALVLLVALSALKANDETPYPLGTSDLVPHHPSEEFITKLIKIESTEIRLEGVTFELPSDFEESSIEDYHFLADQLSISALRKENKELKNRVAELEAKIARLEELLTKKGVNQAR